VETSSSVSRTRVTPRSLRRPPSALVQLADEAWLRLIDRVGDRVLLTRIASAEDAAQAPSDGADVLLLGYTGDGSATSERRWLTFLSSSTQVTRLPIIVYAPFLPGVARSVADWTAMGVSGVVFENIDDVEGASFGEMLRLFSSRAVARELVRDLLREARGWPETLCDFTGRLFVAPWKYRSVGDMARDACLTRRTFERWLARAEVSSARSLLLVARLAWIYGEGRTAVQSPRAIARAAGFRNSAQMYRALDSVAQVRDLQAYLSRSRTRVSASLRRALRTDVESNS
jgi:hypothetical protein